MVDKEASATIRGMQSFESAVLSGQHLKHVGKDQIYLASQANVKIQQFNIHDSHHNFLFKYNPNSKIYFE